MLDEPSLQVSWAARSVHVACIQHTAAQRHCKREALENNTEARQERASFNKFDETGRAFRVLQWYSLLATDIAKRAVSANSAIAHASHRAAAAKERESSL
jgi:hypothetical protein